MLAAPEYVHAGRWACSRLPSLGRLSLFAETRPGPKGPRKATGHLRARVLELRAAGHCVTEITAACLPAAMSCKRAMSPTASSACANSPATDIADHLAEQNRARSVQCEPRGAKHWW